MTPANLDRAVKLLNEGYNARYGNGSNEAEPFTTSHFSAIILARILDEHDAFKRELSDVLRSYRYDTSHATLGKFIIPEPVDLLAEAWEEAMQQPAWISKFNTFKDGLASRGLRIAPIDDQPDNHAVHMAHCGELNDGVCKYGDDDCPAIPVTKQDAAEVWRKAIKQPSKEAAIAVIAEALGQERKP